MSEPPRLTLSELGSHPRAAQSAVAFDADGTLWRGDVGELLLQGMIGLGRAPVGASSRYEAMLATDAPAACAFCVELLRGLPEDVVESWSRELIRANRHGPLFKPMVELARTLLEQGAEVFVVSGSNLWTVRAGLEAAGLGGARILAVTTPVEQGLCSGRVDQPVTCGPGKVSALRAATQRPLLLAAGNALYDADLLAEAEIPLVVAPRDHPTPLRALAATRGWQVVDV
jgi:phosphoserine phosphatase